MGRLDRIHVQKGASLSEPEIGKGRNELGVADLHILLTAQELCPNWQVRLWCSENKPVVLSCSHSQGLGGSFQSFTKATTDCTCLWDLIEDLTHDVILQGFRIVIKLAFVIALLLLQMFCAHEALFPWPQVLTVAS